MASTKHQQQTRLDRTSLRATHEFQGSDPWNALRNATAQLLDSLLPARCVLQDAILLRRQTRSVVDSAFTQYHDQAAILGPATVTRFQDGLGFPEHRFLCFEGSFGTPGLASADIKEIRNGPLLEAQRLSRDRFEDQPYRNAQVWEKSK